MYVFVCMYVYVQNHARHENHMSRAGPPPCVRTTRLTTLLLAQRGQILAVGVGCKCELASVGMRSVGLRSVRV